MDTLVKHVVEGYNAMPTVDCARTVLIRNSQTLWRLWWTRFSDLVGRSPWGLLMSCRLPWLVFSVAVAGPRVLKLKAKDLRSYS